jgi:hypothetical protein
MPDPTGRHSASDVQSLAPEVIPMQSHPHPACLRRTVLVLLAGCAFQAHAGERSSYFYNEGNDAIRSIQVKQEDGDSWTDVDVGDGIDSGKAMKLHLLAEGRGRCRYDVKTMFAKGPALLHRQMDLCAVSTYSPERYRQFAIERARREGHAKYFRDSPSPERVMSTRFSP